MIIPSSSDSIPCARSITKICCLHLVTVLEEVERGKKLLQQKYEQEMEVTEILVAKVSKLFICRITVVGFFPGYGFLNP